MRLLLDTHALIWWFLDDPRLPVGSCDAMRSPDNSVYVSAATDWEIATKARLGTLKPMAGRVDTLVQDVLDAGFHHLPVTPDHGIAGGSLAGAHKDPFDRLIAAQALIEDMVVVTRDPAIASFGCAVLW